MKSVGADSTSVFCSHTRTHTHMDQLSSELRSYGIRHTKQSNGVFVGTIMLLPSGSGVSATSVAKQARINSTHAGNAHARGASRHNPDIVDLNFVSVLQAAKYVREKCLKSDCWKKVHGHALYCRFHMNMCETCYEPTGESEFTLRCTSCSEAVFCTVKCMNAGHDCGAVSSL